MYEYSKLNLSVLAMQYAVQLLANSSVDNRIKTVDTLHAAERILNWLITNTKAQ